MPFNIEVRRREIINRAWEVLGEGLENEDLPFKLRMENAAKLAVKDMPTEIIGDLKHIVQMPSILKGEGKLEFNIGQQGEPSA